MVVFKYIEDKDVFQKFYSKMLAKRLVQHMSASDDAEASMISKLKQACGFEYTNKLQRMFQDVGVSKDLNTTFVKHLQEAKAQLDIDFQIQVSVLEIHSFEHFFLFLYYFRFCPLDPGLLRSPVCFNFLQNSCAVLNVLKISMVVSIQAEN